MLRKREKRNSLVLQLNGIPLAQYAGDYLVVIYIYTLIRRALFSVSFGKKRDLDSPTQQNNQYLKSINTSGWIWSGQLTLYCRKSTRQESAQYNIGPKANTCLQSLYFNTFSNQCLISIKLLMGQVHFSRDLHNINYSMS